VTYISGRSVSLMATLYLSALLLYLRNSYWSVVPFVLALGVKETAVTLPAALLLVELVRAERAPWRLQLPHWMALAAAALVVLLVPRYFDLVAYGFSQRGPLESLLAQVGGISYLLARLVTLQGYNIERAREPRERPGEEQPGIRVLPRRPQERGAPGDGGGGAARPGLRETARQPPAARLALGGYLVVPLALPEAEPLAPPEAEPPAAPLGLRLVWLLVLPEPDAPPGLELLPELCAPVLPAPLRLSSPQPTLARANAAAASTAPIVFIAMCRS